MTMTDDRPDATLAAGPAGPAQRPGAVAPRLADLVTPLFGGRLPIRIRAWDGTTAGPTDGTVEAPTIVVRDRDALRRLVRHPGELGLAQAYVTGEIDVEGDLRGGLRRVWSSARTAAASTAGDRAVNHARTRLPVIARAVRTAYGLGAVGLPPEPPVSQARLRGRLHTKVRDRSAIEHHYNLSNDFYALILDPQMAYSCGYWTSDEPGYTVEDAQRDKLDLVCRKLGIEPGGRHLDIGCGWGSLSLHAASTTARTWSA